MNHPPVRLAAFASLASLTSEHIVKPYLAQRRRDAVDLSFFINRQIPVNEKSAPLNARPVGIRSFSDFVQTVSVIILYNEQILSSNEKQNQTSVPSDSNRARDTIIISLSLFASQRLGART
jgi:hypothetical protein